MKKIISFVALLIFVLAVNAQPLYTISTSSSSDGGNTFQLGTVDSIYHDATHCRPAYTYVWQFDSIRQQLKRAGYQTIDYYDNGNSKQNVSQVWDSTSGTYVNVNRTTYTYFQSTSKKTTTLNEIWNITAWQNLTLETNTYDANGFITDNLKQTWNILSNTWGKTDETVYYNNSKGTPDSLVEQKYQNNLPAAKTKNTYTYDAVSGLTLQEVKQNFVNNQWQNSERTTDTYDPNGHLTITLVETYVNSQWQNYERLTFTYDAAGNNTGTTTEFYFGGTWLNVSRTILTYYANGKLNTIEGDSFSQATQSWVAGGKTTYMYNADGNPIEIATYNYLSGTSTIASASKISFSYQPCTAATGTPGEICPGGSASFTAGLTGATYQWQVNAGGGFVNVANSGNYTGATTATLNLSNIPSSWYGYQYRCIVNNQNSSIFTIKFVNKWTGASNNLWNNTANWSCGILPDANTDVIVDSGTVLLNIITSVRSLTVKPAAVFTANTGASLTILH